VVLLYKLTRQRKKLWGLSAIIPFSVRVKVADVQKDDN
jgi:hypothetical protein